MQQEGGGGGGGGAGAGAGGQQQSHQYGEMAGAVSEATSTEQMVVEAASPISSRPPAGGNLDEFMRLASSVGGGDELGLGGGSGGGGGGSGGGGTSGNRWPRQETLALLKIRSDMDTTFRDATVKGPLWEDVSRKMAELGFKRSAKKCREKFENVHKYYKRTKETRAGRQDGKSYKFFSELEAFHTPPATVSIPVTPAATAIATTLDVAPVSVGIPMPICAARIIPPPTTAVPMSSSLLPMPGSTPAAPVSFPPQQPALAPVSAPASAPPIATTAAQFGISFSSNSSTFSQGFDDDDDDEDEVGVGGGEPSSMAGTSRKRKRSSSSRGGGGGTTRKMMEFFEGLMKQVMQKQEAMQQRFLEAIEKREQDRTIREEAWKRQESARLTREHELMAQERSIAASRDAAIISFLQKITGQTIQLPTTVIIPAAAPPPPPPPSQPATPVVQPAQPNPTTALPLQQPPPPPPPQQQQSLVSHHHQHQQHNKHHQHQQRPISSEIVMAIPEQQVPPSEIGGSGGEPASSRWPKAEVLALINLRTGLESRYQEAGPKGPLWEEISAAMSRLGYNRNPKRCKEKWENINKYFKKVKESNKKRPEDAKTCPYFHQLDALYRKKILGGGGGTSSGSFSDHNRPEEPPSTAAAPQQSEHETGATANVVTSKEGNDGATKEPEDIVRELMDEHRKGLNQQQQHNHQGQSFMVDGYDKIDEPESDNMEDDEEVDEEDYDEEEEDEEMEEEKKMGYKIEFQRQNPSSNPNGGGGNNNGAPSFFTMVQ